MITIKPLQRTDAPLGGQGDEDGYFWAREPIMHIVTILGRDLQLIVREHRLVRRGSADSTSREYTIDAFDGDGNFLGTLQRSQHAIPSLNLDVAAATALRLFPEHA